MSLIVLKSGIQTTVQDLGSPCAMQAGIAAGGAADPLSCRLANWLVGNPGSAAVLEITLGNVRIRAGQDHWLALTGAPCSMRVNGRPRTMATAFVLHKGEELHIAAPHAGLRSYLAVAGGLDADEFMGSRSTRLQAACGGWQGRALRPGDELPVAPGGISAAGRAIRMPALADWVRILPGPQWPWLDEVARHTFLQTAWQIDPASNRMGARLQGAALERLTDESLFSHPVLPGSVQLPPAGQPIVLLADAQLTGGYPLIAQVIAADVWRCGQWRAGQSVHFVRVDQAEALTALRLQREWLARLQKTLGVCC